MEAVYQRTHIRTVTFVTVLSFYAALLTGCAHPASSDTLLQDQMSITDDNMDDDPEESLELYEESFEQEIESKEKIDTEAAKSESNETDAGTAADIKNITWEQVDYNIVDLHFIFENTVIGREIVAYSVRDIVYEDITGDGVEETLYIGYRNGKWELVQGYSN